MALSAEETKLRLVYRTTFENNLQPGALLRAHDGAGFERRIRGVLHEHIVMI